MHASFHPQFSSNISHQHRQFIQRSQERFNSMDFPSISLQTPPDFHERIRQIIQQSQERLNSFGLPWQPSRFSLPPPSFHERTWHFPTLQFQRPIFDLYALLPVRSIASRLMTILTTWRNMDGKEANWQDEGMPYWKSERSSIEHYAKAVLAEHCLPVITTIAVVETVVYSIFSLFGSSHSYKLLQSSSFTILWSLADLFYNHCYTNILTDESKAQSFASNYFGYAE